MGRTNPIHQPELGQRLTELRLARGYTQQELRERSHVSVRTIQRIESGAVTPRTVTIKILLDALGENADDWFAVAKDTQRTFSDVSLRQLLLIDGSEAAIKKALMPAWISGILYLLMVLCEQGLSLFSDYLDDAFGLLPFLVAVKVMAAISFVVFTRGILALSLLFEVSLLRVSAYVPLNGFGQLIQSLAETIEQRGGRVRKNCTASACVKQGSSITKVQIGPDEYLDTDLVISTLSPRLTCQLIGDCTLQDFEYEPSHSLTSIYAGMRPEKQLLKQLQRGFNWWTSSSQKPVYDQPDMLKPPTHLFVGSQQALLPIAKRKEIIDLTIFAPGNYEQSRQAYEQGSVYYDDFKKKSSETVMQAVEQLLLPGLKQQLSFTSMVTPWDIHQELGVERGNVYGRRLTPESVLSATEPIKGIDNLILANASVGLPGIATCFNTASIFFQSLTGIQI
jgi:phytoene dehydrogenase-like protein/DNA-binding XRE family transcriptional regulator